MEKKAGTVPVCPPTPGQQTSVTEWRAGVVDRATRTCHHAESVVQPGGGACCGFVLLCGDGSPAGWRPQSSLPAARQPLSVLELAAPCRLASGLAGVRLRGPFPASSAQTSHVLSTPDLQRPLWAALSLTRSAQTRCVPSVCCRDGTLSRPG